jgi:hypothetical protein
LLDGTKRTDPKIDKQINDILMLILIVHLCQLTLAIDWKIIVTVLKIINAPMALSQWRNFTSCSFLNAFINIKDETSRQVADTNNKTAIAINVRRTIKKMNKMKK